MLNNFLEYYDSITFYSIKKKKIVKRMLFVRLLQLCYPLKMICFQFLSFEKIIKNLEPRIIVPRWRPLIRDALECLEKKLLCGAPQNSGLDHLQPKKKFIILWDSLGHNVEFFLSFFFFKFWEHFEVKTPIFEEKSTLFIVK